jgi:hypothetical protein
LSGGPTSTASFTPSLAVAQQRVRLQQIAERGAEHGLRTAGALGQAVARRDLHDRVRHCRRQRVGAVRVKARSAVAP